MDQTKQVLINNVEGYYFFQNVIYFSVFNTSNSSFAFSDITWNRHVISLRLRLMRARVYSNKITFSFNDKPRYEPPL